MLAGDGLLSLAFEIMSEQVTKYPGNAALCQAMYCVARNCGVTGMVSGQARDLASEGKQISSNELRRLQTEKTSALISAACVSGALIGGADETQRRAMESYGLHLGLAFQIADDILDVTGDEQTLGKTPGKDEKAGKPTYPLMYGLEQATLLARRSANLAIEALEPFDGKADFLRKTAISAVLRSN